MTVFDPNRLPATFARLKAEGRPALVTFLSAGDPDGEHSAQLLGNLPKAGADIIEIGMPFSDPMADGPTIQRSSKRALKSGVTLKKTLVIAENFRKAFPDIPIVLMGYYNPIYQFGAKKFIEEVKRVGVDGLIVVDLPPEEDPELAIPAHAENIHFIRLVTPTSDPERLKSILKYSSGFIYYVSIKGITGTKQADATEITSHLQEIRQQTNLPICIGFGIRTPEDARTFGKISEGVVVGSALIEALEEGLTQSDPEHGIKLATHQVEQLAKAVRSLATPKA